MQRFSGLTRGCRLNPANTLRRPYNLLGALLIAATIWLAPMNALADTYTTGAYVVETSATSGQPYVRFFTYQKWYYTPSSDHFYITWDDLRIDIYNLYELDRAQVAFYRTYPSPNPYSGCLSDDNAPSSFSYYNTPAWAEVPANAWTYEGDSFYRYIGDSYWSSTQPIRHLHRGSGFGEDKCNTLFWSYAAGMELSYSTYSPYSGFYYASYSPGP